MRECVDGIRMTFQSILFDRLVSEADAGAKGNLPFFHDLNLDQVFDSLGRGREEYDLNPLFSFPLDDAGAITYRHEVMRELEGKESLRSCVESFAQGMRIMRDQLSQSGKLHYRYQKASWFLDAAETYCDAVNSLHDGLKHSDAESRGFQALQEYLGAYVSSSGFASLLSETKKLKKALSEVRYRLQLQGSRVTVSRHAEEPNYSAEVEQTFHKFQEGKVSDYAMAGRPQLETPDMNHVEAGILDIVAKLYPDIFVGLLDYQARNARYLDTTIRRFDREIQFYLCYLQLMRNLRAAGLDFCYPRVSDKSKAILARETFDLALANMLTREGSKVVCNDFYLAGPERIIVVSGPNQGGKTTFARTFGQLHYLARLGYPVPGKEAQLFLCDDLFTHFEREARIENLRGKLQDELLRMHEVLQQATGGSIVIVNEGFESTTLSDADFLGREILQKFIELDLLCVYVTFIEELSTLGKATVSMVSAVVPENPTLRTYKIVRKPADGRAYAMAIAEKYGLSYQSVKRRVAR